MRPEQISCENGLVNGIKSECIKKISDKENAGNMIEYFDAHAHYDDEQFNDDRDELINQMKDFGVTRITCNGYSLQGSLDAYKLAQKYDFIYFTVGISPNDLTENWQEDVDKLEEIIVENNVACAECGKNGENLKSGESKEREESEEHISCEVHGGNEQQEKSRKHTNKLVAIGEIGLDYHYDTNKDWQRQAFIKQIELANKYNLPITIHTREAVMDVLQILKENPVDKKGVFHCCPFNRELVKEALKLGYYISFSGTCTFKNAKNSAEIIDMVPNDRFTIETDSPYLAPEPNRGHRNDSRNLKYIVERIAAVKNLQPAEIARLAYDNANALYRIDNKNEK